MEWSDVIVIPNGYGNSDMRRKISFNFFGESCIYTENDFGFAVAGGT